MLTCTLNMCTHCPYTHHTHPPHNTHTPHTPPTTHTHHTHTHTHTTHTSQLVNVDSYNFQVFGQVVIVNLALNQTWTALLIALICAFPIKAFRFSPIVSSVAGFTSGFFIPINDIPWW